MNADQALTQFCKESGLNEKTMRERGFCMEPCRCGCKEFTLRLPTEAEAPQYA